MRLNAAGLGRVLVTAAATIAAGAVAVWLWTYYMVEPWTRDGRVSADVIGVTPDVSGLIAAVMVHDNQAVRAGDKLFEIDRARFSLAVRQAEAALAARLAALTEARREAERYASLNSIAVSLEKQQQTQAALQQAAAAFQQSQADLGVAKLNYDRADVTATANGIVTNFDLRPGDYVSAGKPVFALVDTDSVYVSGYFEETKLGAIHPGDAATVRLLGQDEPLAGHVESIAGAIADRERTGSADLLANINPTFTWVRLAQRVPVRIKLQNVPDTVPLLPGRTATVIIHPGTASEPRSARAAK